MVPFSVLIGQGEIVKISDFGTSREWNEKSTKMSFAGTVQWMAPEIIRNEPCSEKVDIWYILFQFLFELIVSQLIFLQVDKMKAICHCYKFVSFQVIWSSLVGTINL